LKEVFPKMKLTPMIFRMIAVSLLLTGALAQAAQVTGTVTDKTTGKPAVGDTVVLVDVQAGMNEAAKATTDARGHYSLNEPGSGPYLVRVTHQGAGYFIAAPQGSGPGDITVYDVAAKVDGVGIDEDVIGLVETPACRRARNGRRAPLRLCCRMGQWWTASADSGREG
jgi:hypothetical protein